CADQHEKSRTRDDHQLLGEEPKKLFPGWLPFTFGFSLWLLLFLFGLRFFFFGLSFCRSSHLKNLKLSMDGRQANRNCVRNRNDAASAQPALNCGEATIGMVNGCFLLAIKAEFFAEQGAYCGGSCRLGGTAVFP